MGTESKYVVIAGETATDAELKSALDMEQETTVWRVLKRSGADPTRWNELGTIEDRSPDATDLGDAFGEGDYLIFVRDSDSRYGYRTLRPISVVAETRFRERTDEDES